MGVAVATSGNATAEVSTMVFQFFIEISCFGACRKGTAVAEVSAIARRKTYVAVTAKAAPFEF